MRLLTHNYLQSNVRGTDKGYPLTIEATQVVIEESPVDKDLVLRLLPKLDYAALVAAAQQVAPQCPPDANRDVDFFSLPPANKNTNDTISNSNSVLSLLDTGSKTTETNRDAASSTTVSVSDQQQPLDTNNEALVARLHRLLFDIHIVEGHLICPDTGRRFPIKEGIPNMILHEDEI